MCLPETLQLGTWILIKFYELPYECQFYLNPDKFTYFRNSFFPAKILEPDMKRLPAHKICINNCFSSKAIQNQQNSVFCSAVGEKNFEVCSSSAQLTYILVIKIVTILTIPFLLSALSLVLHSTSITMGWVVPKVVSFSFGWVVLV